MSIFPDLTDPNAVKEAIDSVILCSGRLDVLYNNAAISFRTPLVYFISGAVIPVDGLSRP